MSMRTTGQQRTLVYARRDRLKAEGVCIDCGRHPAVPGPRGGRMRCETCRIKQQESVLRYRKRRRREEPGKCAICFKRPATPGPRGGTTACDVCRERSRDWKEQHDG